LGVPVQELDLDVDHSVVVLPALVDVVVVAAAAELILETCTHAGFAPRRTVETGQVAAAGHLAAAGLGVTIIPSNVVPTGLNAAIRSLKPPLARQLVAFTRQDWSPLAAAFLEVLQSQVWQRRSASATVLG
jgi:DNA-binding transcriptional LysR family regulator